MSDNVLHLVLFWPSVGTVVNKRFTRNRKLPPTVARRRGQGVISGLAARKNAVLYKGISPLNRPVQNRPAPNSAAVNKVMYSRVRILRLLSKHIEKHDRPPSSSEEESKCTSKLVPVVTLTSTNSSGILTVSIDNPTARTQPRRSDKMPHIFPIHLFPSCHVSLAGLTFPACCECESGNTEVMMFGLAAHRPAQSWSLHPVTPARSSPPPEEPKRKPPKRVALQFDINSVGKQVVTLDHENSQKSPFF
ncbi:UAP56-interacting factor-like [Carassius gibelio]|uniref:UAP56-interacting factor-like n=1 Tax=Carassius gibelio TaxID=101364 RepID=UPI002278EDF1|nr:UAP56-interacting factor-like [Carassius gibelio]